MSERDAHVVRLFDKKGELYGVLISPEMWCRVERKVAPILENVLEAMYPSAKAEPLEEWQEFQDYWDFKYPYCADVHCEQCGAATEDWVNDPFKPFRFKGASLSGLAVFSCIKCGATIRKKHFKDHIVFECSKSGCGCG